MVTESPKHLVNSKLSKHNSVQPANLNITNCVLIHTCTYSITSETYLDREAIAELDSKMKEERKQTGEKVCDYHSW